MENCPVFHWVCGFVSFVGIMKMNGEIRMANESMARALLEIQKLWDGAEVRLKNEEILDKLSALKEIVNFAEEIGSYLAKFQIISK